MPARQIQLTDPHLSDESMANGAQPLDRIGVRLEWGWKSLAFLEEWLNPDCRLQPEVSCGPERGLEQGFSGDSLVMCVWGMQQHRDGRDGMEAEGRLGEQQRQNSQSSFRKAAILLLLWFPGNHKCLL
jgi:hypothetical protein